MSIVRKEKICKHCKNLRYLFSKGYCKNCWNLLFSKPIATNKKIKTVSDNQKIRLQKYNNLRLLYLKDHSICEVKDCRNPSTEIHHKGGRIGENLFKNFLAVCRDHHLKIESDPQWAKENNYSIFRYGKHD